ncbi:MAG TPA: flagellar FliJ family protein [Candidatus Goldiibacteriota bacterium]|nr:flagellar FliJ family protein [Candidatus Goldiibacteriota bacterium]
MKKFRFKLQTVLDVKEKKEEMLRNELMKLQALKLEQEQLREAINEEKKNAAHERSKESGTGCDITRLRQFEEYISSLLGRITRTEDRIRELQAEADAKRVEVIKASKETKTFRGV